MELGLINHDDEEFEEQEQALCALMGEETIAETNMWEDPECQMFNAIDQSGKQTSLCWQCHKPGHQKRDCWIRPRNQMIMNSRGGGNTRNNSSPYRTQFSRGRGRARGGSPSAAYRHSAEITQQAGRGGPQAFMGQPRRNGGATNYANALFNIHEEEQSLYLHAGLGRGHQVTSTQDGENQSPAAAVNTDPNGTSTSTVRPAQSPFSAN